MMCSGFTQYRQRWAWMHQCHSASICVGSGLLSSGGTALEKLEGEWEEREKVHTHLAMLLSLFLALPFWNDLSASMILLHPYSLFSLDVCYGRSEIKSQRRLKLAKYIVPIPPDALLLLLRHLSSPPHFCPLCHLWLLIQKTKLWRCCFFHIKTVLS